MTEIMPHSENNLNLFYWTPPWEVPFPVQFMPVTPGSAGG